MRGHLPQLRRLGLKVLIAGLAVCNIGCAALVVGGAAAGGAAGYAYYRGNISRDFTAPLDDTEQATLAAIHELGLPIVSQTVSAESRKLNCTSGAGDGVNIYLEPIANLNRQPVTRVHIRVGWFGDRQLSASLHDRIAAHLFRPVYPTTAQPPAAPPPPQRLVPTAATVEPPLGTDEPASAKP